MTESLMSTIILISTTSHMALAGIYNYPPLLPLLYLFYPWQAPQQLLALPEGVFHTFIAEGTVVVSH